MLDLSTLTDQQQAAGPELNGFNAGFIAGLECQQAALVAALRPLAALWRPAMEYQPDSKPIYGLEDTVITVGDVKAARAALAGVGGAP